MRSLRSLVVVVALLGGEGVRGVPNPIVTPAPRCADVDVDALIKRQLDPDAVSFAKILLTAIPESLRQIAATNLQAVSTILWEQFLDDQRPQWFRDLPTDIQSYLIREFGPQTAAPPDEPGATAPATNWPGETSQQWWPPPESSAVPSWNDPTVPTTIATSGEPSNTFSANPSSSNPTETDSLASTGSASFSSLTETKSLDPTRSASTKPSSSNPSETESSSESSTSDPDAPPANNSGLTKNQKIGIGVGVPLSIAVIGALFFGCCLLWRRRKRQNIEGSVSPSSPGFIPRFAFQEKSTEHLEHREPLTRGTTTNQAQDQGYMGWDEDVIEAMETSRRESPYPYPYPSNQPGTAIQLHDPKPIMAPALYHTHSSNRARGKRTSYQSLHSVAELTEPDDEHPESPVLGRNVSHPRRPSIDLPPVPEAATIKRKPVAQSPTGTSPVADSPSHLQRPTFPNLSRSSSSGLALSSPLLPPVFPSHSGSSSSGLGLNTSSALTSTSSGIQDTDTTSPVSPISDNGHKETTTTNNPYSGGYSWVEDYGPEYHQSGYVDVEDGLYGGHRSLSRYPERPRRGSREWPLKNALGSIGHRRNKSPLWDRVYDEH